jgi:predicted S18 family serine protease
MKKILAIALLLTVFASPVFALGHHHHHHNHHTHRHA